MPDVPTPRLSSGQALPPELCWNVVSVARALLAAARSWTLYTPDHPSLGASIDRLHSAIAAASAGGAFSFGVTPTDLLVEGIPVPGEAVVSEAAAWLHARDVLRMTIAGAVDASALHRLLALLADD